MRIVIETQGSTLLLKHSGFKDVTRREAEQMIAQLESLKLDMVRLWDSGSDDDIIIANKNEHD